MADVTEKLPPGGEIPWAECESCGAFFYVADMESRLGTDGMVRECRLKDAAINR